MYCGEGAVYNWWRCEGGVGRLVPLQSGGWSVGMAGREKAGFEVGSVKTN